MRLRYWTLVRESFGKEYDEQLRRGFQAAGLKMPDFARMGRADLLGHIRDLDGAKPKLRDDGAALAGIMATLRLLRGLRDLDSDIIPRRWI